jgi:tRNA/tmRNA/rRNA uracil-C5-methylase (TrmA/RlmC/RlmD family)
LWRRRARLFVEKRIIGFKSFRGSEVIPVGRCPQLTETLNKALLSLYTYPSVLKQAEEIWMGEDKDQKQLLV